MICATTSHFLFKMFAKPLTAPRSLNGVFGDSGGLGELTDRHLPNLGLSFKATFSMPSIRGA